MSIGDPAQQEPDESLRIGQQKGYKRIGKVTRGKLRLQEDCNGNKRIAKVRRGL